jgi:hypothetical protein
MFVRILAMLRELFAACLDGFVGFPRTQFAQKNEPRLRTRAIDTLRKQA